MDNLLQQAFNLHQGGSFDDAKKIYASILSSAPQNFDALFLFGMLSAQTGNTEQVIDLLGRAIKINPDFEPAHSNLGIAYLNEGSYQKSIDSFLEALRLNSKNILTHLNLGNAFQFMHNFDSAIYHYNQAIALNPQLADAHNNKANALQAIGQYEKAIESYDVALTIDPYLSSAHNNKANALQAIGQYEKAIESYDAALTLDPNIPFAAGISLHCKMRICQWQDKTFNTQLKRIESLTELGARVISPLFSLSAFNSPKLLLTCAKTWAEYKAPNLKNCLPKPVAKESKKIRIGYFSSDFCDHPISQLIIGMIQKHDREAFEVIGFSLRKNQPDFMKNRIESVFDRFFNVEAISNFDIASLSRRLEIDIAIDLNGYTNGERSEIFSLRVAPLQISYLGFLGTLGNRNYEYLIADQTLIPNQMREHYSERIIYLPCFQVNDDSRPIPKNTVTKSELGLPEDRFVFCCFNNCYKITPAIFNAWMRILLATPNSILFLYEENSWVCKNLREEAQNSGVDPGRLFFGKRLKTEEYLSRFKAADLFLDTSPYNGGTTTSDALWAGLPVLTLAGKTFSSRMGASLLNAIEIPRLIANSIQEYEQIAIKLATNTEELANCRRLLDENRQTKDLFKTAQFTRSIEKAFLKIQGLAQNNLPPCDIHIS
jgi:predicted O-linked N-acetylglucosamine transferase (SPINDLY family)